MEWIVYIHNKGVKKQMQLIRNQLHLLFTTGTEFGRVRGMAIARQIMDQYAACLLLADIGRLRLVLMLVLVTDVELVNGIVIFPIWAYNTHII